MAMQVNHGVLVGQSEIMGFLSLGRFHEGEKHPSSSHLNLVSIAKEGLRNTLSI
jgi:hypothetical protein